MATAVKGFLTRAGFAPAPGPWGTARVLGAGHLKEYVSESMTPDSQLVPDEQMAGNVMRLRGDQGNEFHNGDLVMDMKYEGLEDVLGLAMGDANGGAAPPQVASDNAYKHILKPAPNKEGKYATLVIDKTLEVWEYPTAKVGGFTIDMVPGRRARITVPMIPQGLNINTSSGSNTTTTAGTLTMPTNRDFALFADTAVRMNLTSGGALAAADLAYITEFHLTLNNGYPTDDVTTRYGRKIDEPIADVAEVTGSFTFSKYMTENKVWMSRILDKQSVKCDVVCTGRIANGTTNFKLAFFMPDIQFASGAPNVGGSGRVPFSPAFRANRVSVVPTGWTAGYVDGLTIENINQRTTNANATS